MFTQISFREPYIINKICQSIQDHSFYGKKSKTDAKNAILKWLSLMKNFKHIYDHSLNNFTE